MQISGESKNKKIYIMNNLFENTVIPTTERMIAKLENHIRFLEDEKYITTEINTLIEKNKKDLAYSQERLREYKNIVERDNMTTLYKSDNEKSVIYNEKTDKDICMYFDNETRDWLLDILNNNTKKE